jgi:hypothetical protein
MYTRDTIYYECPEFCKDDSSFFGAIIDPFMQGDQNVSEHLMITGQKLSAFEQSPHNG